MGTISAARIAVALGIAALGTGASAQTLSADETAQIISFGLMAAIGIALWLVPTFVAFRRRSRYRYIILILNLTVSFTGIGWLAILIWSIWPDNRQEQPLVVNVRQYGDSEKPPAPFGQDQPVGPAPASADKVTARSSTNPFAEFFGRYFDFQGRTSRRAFWITSFVVTPLLFLALILPEVVNPGDEESTGLLSLLSSIFVLAAIVPLYSLPVRRLHDIGRSGWWALLQLTGIGAVFLIPWFCRPGIAGANQFGGDPLERVT